LLASYAFDLELAVRLETEKQCLIPIVELELVKAKCQAQEESLQFQKGKIEHYEKERILLATELQRQIALEIQLKGDILSLKKQLESRKKEQEERKEEEKKLERLLSKVKKGMEEFGI